MSILVTGGAGFVGMNVVEALLGRGDEVVVFDAGELPAGADAALEPHRSRLAVERGSVLHPAELEAVFRKHRIERVIHAAAVTSGPRREALEPGSIVDVNVRGTINVLEAASKHQVARTVYVGSGAAYGESLYELSSLYEDSPSVPTTLYSITKHAAERACMRLKALWKIDVVCARLGTVVGPWERDTGVRDNFGTHSQLAAMAAAGEAALLPEREVQRDWVYARDVAEGLIALAYAPRLRHELYNLSSGETWQEPIATWCGMLGSAYPGFGYRFATGAEQANVWYTDTDRGIMDIGRISQDIGFSVQYPMHHAYEDFLEWLTKKNPGSKAGGNRGG
jgi:nucleoside-diphosphate-sugar epimerase